MTRQVLLKFSYGFQKSNFGFFDRFLIPKKDIIEGFQKYIMTPRSGIVKRLVKEVENLSVDKDLEEHPLEYYEMRDLAKLRVVLRSSVRSHLFIYSLINILLILANIFADPNPINYIFEIWALWVVIGWGLLLWVHSVIIWGIIKIKNLDLKIYAIISLILVYIALLLIYVNYLTIYYSDSTYHWWPWSTAGIVIGIGAYAYIVHEMDEGGKMKIRIEDEMKKIQAKENEKTKSKSSKVEEEE